MKRMQTICALLALGLLAGTVAVANGQEKKEEKKGRRQGAGGAPLSGATLGFPAGATGLAEGLAVPAGLAAVECLAPGTGLAAVEALAAPGALAAAPGLWAGPTALAAGFFVPGLFA